MAVGIDTKEECWTTLSVYAPQAGCSGSEKDEFYLCADDAIRSVPDDHCLTIAADLSGYVGGERR
ncbi:hypothetical protein TELCIR_12560, partial [Teladorsagia circumcincta]